MSYLTSQNDLVFGALEHFVVWCTCIGEGFDARGPQKRAARVPADPGDDCQTPGAGTTETRRSGRLRAGTGANPRRQSDDGTACLDGSGTRGTGGPPSRGGYVCSAAQNPLQQTDELYRADVRSRPDRLLKIALRGGD